MNKAHEIISSIPKITRVAGETMDWKDWVVDHESLSGNDWALNVSKGEEIEQGESQILVKIKEGVMTVLYQKEVYQSGIVMKDPHFISDKFKNSIARVFRGLQTGKVSWTHLQETYDLNNIKGSGADD